jgi:hypothetical protein
MLLPLLYPQTENPFIDLAGVSLDIDQGVSNLVAERVPQFVAIDHTSFLTFLQEYYEWMEEEGNPKYVSNRLLDYRDVDDTLDTLLVRFLSEYADGLPSTLASTQTDKRKMVKRMVDFYRAKGTEKSYKTFFRLLYGEEPDFYYPAEDILTLSAGKWVQPTFIRTTANMADASILDLPGRRVHQRGLTHGAISAYGYVEKAEKKFKDGYEFLEAEISGVFGTFESEREVVYAVTGGATVGEYLFPMLRSAGISSAGTGYKIGDEVVVSGSTSGVGAKIYISSVGKSGDIRGLDILDYGIYYRDKDVLTATVNTSGSGASAEIVVKGGIGFQSREGFWDGEDGILSGAHKTQDNNYYQNFSYVIKSTRNLSEYKQIFKKMVHPAGFRMFGNFLLSEDLTVTGTADRGYNKAESPIIGHYTPYTFSDDRNLRANGVGGSGGLDLYPAGYSWRLAAGNTYYNPTDDVTPPSPIFFFSGTSGPLGGITHVSESTGTAESFGPGGAGNAVQGAQFAVEGTADAFDGVSTGTTGGAYWEIYPHWNARGLTKSFPQNKTYQVSKIKIDQSPPFGTNQIVRQKTPNLQEATGMHLSTFHEAGSTYANIKVLSGLFRNSGETVLGGTSGLLEGPSGGQTASINSVENSHSTSTDSLEMGAITIRNALFEIKIESLSLA